MKPHERFPIVEWNEIASTVGAPPVWRGGVITVPGFNTTGWWQKKVIPILEHSLLFNTPADYGYVRTGILRKKTQEAAAKDIMKCYSVQLAEGIQRPSVIAHSLGSLSLGWALQSRSTLCVSRVIVNGCILPCDFPWKELAEKGQVESVLNEGGGRDRWPRVARWSVPRAGNAGCYGFTNNGGIVINQIDPNGRHSDVHNERHFREVWVPFILTGQVNPPVIPTPAPKQPGLLGRLFGRRRP